MTAVSTTGPATCKHGNLAAWCSVCSGDAIQGAVESWARAGERARIVEALATIHIAEITRRCMECRQPVDSDGDCPTMRIAKGKALRAPS